MADNFLERQYERIREGQVVYRRNTPALETLLHKAADAPADGADRPARAAQLDAVVRAARIIVPDLHYDVSEQDSRIVITGPTSPRVWFEKLGEAVLAMRLKTAELGLRAEVSIVSESTQSRSPYLGEIKLFSKD